MLNNFQHPIVIEDDDDDEITHHLQREPKPCIDNNKEVKDISLSEIPFFSQKELTLHKVSMDKEPTVILIQQMDNLMQRIALLRKVPLLTHQITGVQLILQSLHTRGFALLVDEMGLGKTLTALVVMLSLHRFNIQFPLSLKQQISCSSKSNISSSGIFLVLCPKVGHVFCDKLLSLSRNACCVLLIAVC